jgi:hypothetical protein
MPRKFVRRDTARGYQVTRAQIVADQRLELIGCIAVSVADDYFVADKQKCFSAIGPLNAALFANFVYPGENKIS